MRTKIYFLLYFVLILFLFPITSKAYSLEKNEITIEIENLQSKLRIINLEISTIESNIELYGESYQPYNSYQQVLNSTNEEIVIETYSSNQNSFITIESQPKSDVTLDKLLIEKISEKEAIENNINILNNDLMKLQKLEAINFNSSDVTSISGMTVEDVKYILKGTALEELAQDFIDAEQQYKVNAFFIISICALESGWGTSNRAIYDNNLTGFGVYSDSSEGINSNTKRDNILLTAKTLHNNYLTEGGSCYNGLSVQAINKKYCTSDTWTEKITNIANNLKIECIRNLKK